MICAKLVISLRCQINKTCFFYVNCYCTKNIENSRCLLKIDSNFRGASLFRTQIKIIVLIITEYMTN